MYSIEIKKPRLLCTQWFCYKVNLYSVICKAFALLRVLSVRIVEVINCWLRIVFSVNCQLACFQQLCLNVSVFITSCVFDGTVLLTARRSRVKHDLCTQEVCHVLGIEWTADERGRLDDVLAQQVYVSSTPAYGCWRACDAADRSSRTLWRPFPRRSYQLLLSRRFAIWRYQHWLNVLTWLWLSVYILRGDVLVSNTLWHATVTSMTAASVSAVLWCICYTWITAVGHSQTQTSCWRATFWLFLPKLVVSVILQTVFLSWYLILSSD